MPAVARPWWEAVLAIAIASQLAVALSYVADQGEDSSLAAGPCVVKGADEALGTELLELCRDALPAVTAVWGRDWARRAVIVVEEGDSEVAALVEQGEIRVSAGALTRLSPAGRRVVITHEVTHLATKAARGEGVPTWLVEGFADYVGYLRSGIPVTEAAQELRAEIRAGRVPQALPSEAAFDGAALPSAYAQSWLAVALLVRNHGQPAVVRLYRAVIAGTRLERALPLLLQTTVGELTSAWRAELQRVLR